MIPLSKSSQSLIALYNVAPGRASESHIALSYCMARISVVGYEILGGYYWQFPLAMAYKDTITLTCAS